MNSGAVSDDAAPKNFCFSTTGKDREKAIGPVLQHGVPVSSKARERLSALHLNEIEFLMALAIREQVVF